MKAIQLKEPKNFQRIEIEEPSSPGPGEVLVRVDRVGICGTDLGGYLGKMPFFSYPRIPGHELGVEILEAGSDVTNVKAGDRCSVEPYINCQTCYSCRRGYTNCCQHHQTLGVMCDGGLTERIILPARKMHLANNLSAEQCALVETLAIGCHAVNRGNPQSQETVLIIGAGPIGLSAVEFAKLSGAKTIVMDMVESRLEFVREKMGVPNTILTKADGEEIKLLESLTDGELADIVIDATGSNRSMAQALNYCAFKGRLVYVGITQANVELPHAPALHRRELDILASRNALSSDFTRIIKLIENGSIDTQPWITHRTSFDAMIDEFESFTKPETGVIKAVVEVQ
jgi:2-desacetyl-2-hydroxyethyl bacteriochlorophyllide A dehydrogenase